MGSRAWPPDRPTNRQGREEITGRFQAARLAKLLSSQPWRDGAACAGHPDGLELFFPTRGDAKTAGIAKAICQRCPVRIECLAFAVTTPRETEGIWGGLSPKERRSHLKIVAARTEKRT